MKAIYGSRAHRSNPLARTALHPIQSYTVAAAEPVLTAVVIVQAWLSAQLSFN